MRRHLRNLRPLLAALITVTALSCSFVVDFDPDEKPCAADGGCLTGFTCTAQLVCIRVDAGSPDGGGDGGLPFELPDAGDLEPEVDAGEVL